MLICANVHSTEEFFPVCCLFKSEAELAEAIVHPCCEGITDIIRFVVHGDSYKERKGCVRDLAIAFDHMDKGGISLGELVLVEDWFRKNGKRYGLMDEFVENAIC